MTIVIAGVLTGRVAPFGGGTSAIEKTMVDGRRRVGFLGIEGDAQADLTVHGGPDKAIHHYPRDHYPFWIEQLQPTPVLETAGAFGENISTAGLTEADVCIGDRYRLGTALVEISQGRQPCWKQGHRLGDPRVVALMVRHARCGWYYRVIEPGSVEAGDPLLLASRIHPDWTVARVIGLLIGGMGKHEPSSLKALAAMEELAENWRRRAQKLAGG